MAYRVAAASSDGINIDLHFNQSEKFSVYELTAGVFRFVEEREIKKLFAHSQSEFDKVAALLSDCNAIFVSRLGPGAARYLIARGLRVFEAPYAIDDVLAKFVNEIISQ